MNTRTALLFFATTSLVIVPFTQGSSPEQERDRSYDVLHYVVDIHVDEVNTSVEGTVSMKVVPLREIPTMDVDAAEMTIRDVRLTIRGESIAVRHTSRDGTLSLELPRQMTGRDTFSVSISYACTPRNGLYFNRPDAAYPNTPVQVWSQGEPSENHFWIPCYDSPNDRATVEMRATVNENFVAISNGALLDVTAHPESKTRTYHWYSARPFASYLISLVAGEYVKIEQWYKHIPIQYFVYPDQKDDALRSFSRTPDMVKFFSAKTRFDYPWPKYAQTVIANFTYSGMENASATTLTDRTIHSERAHLDTSSDGLVAHELAHQWFGDLLTCRTWAHAWLNEGFATYFGALYMEHDRGSDEFQHEMLAKQNSVTASDNGDERRPTVTREFVEPIDVFDYHIYGRGACILHMLRFVLGDPVFWKGIQHYVDLYQYDCVTTDDFRHAMEEASHQDLGWFFSEWVMKAGYPVFDVSTNYDAASKKVRVNVRQTHHVDELTPLYRMPVAIELVSQSGAVVHRVMLEAVPEQMIELTSPEEPLDVIFDKGGWLLKRLHHQKSVDAWLLQLQRGDIADREAALRNLGHDIEELRVRSAVANLLEHDTFWGIRAAAAEMPGLFAEPGALTLLMPALRDPVPKVRLAAAASLRNVPGPDAMAVLRGLVEHDSSDAVIGQAIASLVAIDSAHGMAYCRKGLSMIVHSNAVAVASVSALGSLRSTEAKTLLLGLTAYGQPLDVRLAAIDALADTWPSDESVREKLEELLKDKIQRVRRRSIEKLGTLGNAASRTLLQQSLQDEADTILRREARKALAKIGPAGKKHLYH